MFIPSQFYYSETQSSVTYSRTPTGSLNIKELLAGRPCWVAPALSREKKQKKLILADWTASNWSVEKRNNTLKALGDLIDQGFSIYIWNNDSVLPLDKQQLEMMGNYMSVSGQTLRESITLNSAQEIAQAAVVQQKLTQDQVQVIDDYWLKHLLSGKDELEPRVLRMSEMPDMSPETVDKLADVLKCSTPKLSTIIHDRFRTLDNEAVELLANQFSNVKKKCLDKTF